MELARRYMRRSLGRAMRIDQGFESRARVVETLAAIHDKHRQYQAGFTFKLANTP